jgi:hypothetical protein
MTHALTGVETALSLAAKVPQQCLLAAPPLMFRGG